MTKFTPEQIRIAHTLAVAHGHLWATTLTVQDAQRCSTPAEIMQAVRAAGVYDRDPGLWAPQFSTVLPGTLTHTTLTGRSQWDILPSGVVLLSVWRPAQGDRCLVLQVSLFGSGVPEITLGLNPQEAHAPYGTRHVHALSDMLTPLIGAGEAQKLLAPLWPPAEQQDLEAAVAAEQAEETRARQDQLDLILQEVQHMDSESLREVLGVIRAHLGTLSDEEAILE